MKKAFVIWVQEVKLSEFLAREVGAEVIVSCYKRWHGFALPVTLRYLIQGIDTYRRLQKLRPEIIFVQNPPITAVLTVYLYARLNGARYIIDTHTAGFLDRKWAFFHPLHRFLARRALWNTVHNYKNLEYLERWNIPHRSVLQFYNPTRAEVLPHGIKLFPRLEAKLEKNFALKIFMVNRFADDDAWRAVVRTARTMPEAVFFLTGSLRKVPRKIRQKLPANVVLTGYLRHDHFMQLMDRCDVVLALTKRRDTVLWSIREILALRKPFVTSHSDVIQHYFPSVALFSHHTPEDLSRNIRLAWEKRADIHNEMDRFLAADTIRWKNDILELERIIAGSGSQADV